MKKEKLVAIDGKPRRSGNNMAVMVDGRLKLVPSSAVRLIEDAQWAVLSGELEKAVDMTPDLSGFTIDTDALVVELLRRGIWFYEDAKVRGDEIRILILNSAGLAVSEIMEVYSAR